jgi:hypothetical protein
LDTTADLTGVTSREVEDLILDLAAAPAAVRRRRRGAVVDGLRRRSSASSATPEDHFLLGRGLWSLYPRLGAEASVEALRALVRSEADPSLVQMARLIRVYIVGTAGEHRAALVLCDELDRSWFATRDLEWRWLTALEHRFRAMVRLGVDGALDVYEEILSLLAREDEISAAPPRVFADALVWGIGAGRFPADVGGEDPRTVVARLLAGTGMEWVLDPPAGTGAGTAIDR